MSKLTDIFYSRDKFQLHLTHYFPDYVISTYMTPDPFDFDITAVFCKAGAQFKVRIPLDCKDPPQYIRQHYPEFFI